MKAKIKIVSGILTGLVAFGVYAHEGHDKVPGSVRAVKGGVVESGKSIALELSKEADAVKLYPLSHDSKLLSLKDVSVKSAKAKTRKMAKAEDVKLEPAGDAYIVKFDPKGADRFELQVELTYQSKTDAFKFQVEPKE